MNFDFTLPFSCQNPQKISSEKHFYIRDIRNWRNFNSGWRQTDQGKKKIKATALFL